ncbi:TIGR03503 family protein [Ferrimonas sediminum]|uniref:TIGR03503 family protein n=1 Tax=Ferrimonas sediminum TaxID=718193 RepID=A0A1G8X1X3_9GAMM|nr:TIGR03503 family protein [Ferrimonas sediminum]SDJ83825.1 TIGR03503 family protein [Ferrimonas sediminum]
MRRLTAAAFGLLLMGISSMAWAVSPQALKLLDNRFRVDHGIDAITMLVQRKERSAPVIVVLPDGSKWYANRHPESVQWSEGPGGDMIKVTNPTPGPWQLIGQVSEHSKILLISDIQLQLDPLPVKVFRGERIKLNASIEGDSKRLAIRDFHKMLSWEVRLTSSNRPGDENYAAGVRKIGGFIDDGSSLDERPDDGIFTSTLDFNQPSGMYDLKLMVNNKVFSRVIEQDMEIVSQPVRLSVPEKPGADARDFRVHVSVDQEELMPDELHLALSVRAPSGMVSDLALDPTLPQQSYPLSMVMDMGSYVISGIAVGTTIDGKEFYLTLPALNFYVSPPPPPPLSPRERAALVQQQLQEKEDAARWRVISIVVGANALLFGFGIVVLLFWRKRMRLTEQLEAASREAEMQIEASKIDLSS